MDILRCKIRYLTILFLFVSFTAIIVGPLAELVFENPGHKYCYNRIVDVFKVDVGNINTRQLYLRYAILYLRFPKTKDINELINILGLTPEEQETIGDLLYNSNGCVFPPVTTEDFVNKYYRFLSDKFVKDLPEKLSPTEHCKGVEECIYALWYYGFEGNMENITSHAFSDIVLNDFFDDTPFRNISVTRPTHRYYAAGYLFKIAENIKIIEAAMKTPFEYCKNPV